MLVARHFRISGRVQGVGFRYYVERIALREGLSGYVRNLRDGSVETMVEGDAESVGRFDIAVRQGPPGARVRDVETTELTPAGRTTGFMVTG
jgi:acylphosphatase